jgi:hypothetical protein
VFDSGVFPSWAREATGRQYRKVTAVGPGQGLMYPGQVLGVGRTDSSIFHAFRRMMLEPQDRLEGVPGKRTYWRIHRLQNPSELLKIAADS